jgi:cytoskeletal protein CcmA (bactofilin family)
MASGEFAQIGKTVFIKGELSGSEDIYIDGQLEGSVELGSNSVTVGPNGRVHANITAKNVTVGGILDGNIHAAGRTEFRKTAVVNGDVETGRIAIEEGAYFKGQLEIMPASRSGGSSGVATLTASSAPSVPSVTSEPRK